MSNASKPQPGQVMPKTNRPRIIIHEWDAGRIGVEYDGLEVEPEILVLSEYVEGAYWHEFDNPEYDRWPTWNDAIWKKAKKFGKRNAKENPVEFLCAIENEESE